MCGRPVSLAIEVWIIRLIFLEHIVNGCQKHSGNSDDGFFVSPPLFQSKVTAADFRKLLGSDGAQSALDEQRLDVSPGSADPGDLFISGALVVLRRKPSPRAEML